MNQITASLEISPIRAIALSQDLLASYKAIQQLLNTLQVGQVVEATVQTEVINRAERALLIIQDTPVIVADEQLAKLSVQGGDKVLLQVESLNGDQLVLKPAPIDANVAPVSEVVASEQPNSRPAEVVINTTKLLNLIEQINPDKKVMAAIVEMADVVIPANTSNSTYPTQTTGASAENTAQQASNRANPDAATVRTNLIQSQATPDKVTPDKANPDKVSPDKLSAQPPVSDKAQVVQDANSVRANLPPNIRLSSNQPDLNTIRSEIRNDSRANSDTNAVFRADSSAAEKQDSPSKLPSQSIENLQQSANPEANIRATVTGTEQSIVTSSAAPASGATSQSGVVQSGVNSNEQANVATFGQSKFDQTMPNSLIQGTSDTVMPAKDDAKQRFSEPAIKVSVEVPNQQTFPILAEAVSKEAGRLAAKQGPLSQSLNSLLAQLSRLNAWQGDNKRSLRSQAGQQLTKATRDTSVAINDLSRYVINKQQLQTPAQVKKIIKNSGNFFEAKLANQAEAKQSHKTVHQDLKANVQRLLHATLYHIAKLQSQHPSQTPLGAQSTSQSAIANQSVATGQQANIAQTPSTPLKPQTDLVKLVKQKLSAIGNRQLPMDLPSQLIRILKQILNETNRVMTKLQTNQLGNLRADNLTPQWFFEIPVWHQQSVELLQILMRQEQSQREAKKDKVWSLVLQFDLIELGKIRAILRWQDERIDMQFLAEYPPTVELIDSELEFIHDIMQRNQLTLENVAVEQAELRDIEVDFGVAE
ncbi:MAG: flagellar hook-length control protein FliK [Gammaproteobacteria bacterium]